MHISKTTVAFGLAVISTGIHADGIGHMAAPIAFYATLNDTLNDDAKPAMGLRISTGQAWFIFSEARFLHHTPLTRERLLLNSEEPRTLLIGGGIRF